MILAYGEDGRLGAAVIAAAQRGLPVNAVAIWLNELEQPFIVLLSGGPTRAVDMANYAAMRNVHNLTFSIFTKVSLAKEPSDGERRLLEAVRRSLTP